MKKTVLLSLLAANFCGVYAQDVIVKKDGSTILAKVLTIGETEVEYKKFNRQDGPTYKISVDKLLSINHESDDKETFEATSSKAGKPSDNEEGGNGNIQITSDNLSPEAKTANEKAIAAFNTPTEFVTDSKHKDKVGKKRATLSFAVWGASKNSILANEDVEIDLIIGALLREKKSEPDEWGVVNPKKSWIVHNPAVRYTIKNKTSRPVYIDLGNTFLISMQQPTCYYIPSSTTTTQGAQSGASVNIGAVVGALGVGGALGTLAGGVNVGGGSSNNTSNTTYSQRVIAVPPMSTKELDAQYLFGKADREICKGFNYRHYTNWDYLYYGQIFFPAEPESAEMKYGDHYRYTEESSPVNLAFTTCYSFDENFSSSKSLSSYYYLKDLIGAYVNSNNALVGGINSDKPHFTMIPVKKDKEGTNSFPKP